MGPFSILDSWLPDLFSSFASYISLFPDSFLISFLDRRVPRVYKAKEPPNGWLFRKQFPDAFLGFFPEWHSYEPKTKKAQT